MDSKRQLSREAEYASAVAFLQTILIPPTWPPYCPSRAKALFPAAIIGEVFVVGMKKLSSMWIGDGAASPPVSPAGRQKASETA